VADIDVDEVFGPTSRPMVAAAKAARMVIAGEAPDDELRDTDAQTAALFSLDHCDRLRFDHRRKAYMTCDERSSVWRPAASGEALRLFQSWAETRAFERVCQAASKRDVPAIRAAVRRSLSARGLRDVLDLAAHQAAMAVRGDEWDRDPMALATADGQLVDLRTGATRPTRPADMVTLASAVPLDTAARPDRWCQFLTEITNGDVDREALIRLALGYSLTGEITEQVFFVALGGGANGKSTMLETVGYVAGALAGTLPFSVLTRDRDSRAVQAELSDLPGVRFVRASEINEGQHLDAGRFKGFTGGDPISAARKFGHPFTFRPAFKLWLGVNHRPRVNDRSHGFWRRAILIPFERTFPGDKHLERQLRDEAPGILGWLVEAAVDWHRHGLPRSQAVEDARSDWRESEDLIGQWAAQALQDAPEARLSGAHAFKAFTAWAAAEGLGDRERPGARTFGEWMGQRFEAKRTKAGKAYGVRLVTGDGCDESSGNLPHTRARGRTFPDTQHHPSPVTGGEEHVRV
jgi:putative DNA primase/helicase